MPLLTRFPVMPDAPPTASAPEAADVILIAPVLVMVSRLFEPFTATGPVTLLLIVVILFSLSLPYQGRPIRELPLCV